MAFTVRELSNSAKSNLERLLEGNKSILKTKTKAIDYVLKNYYNTEYHIKDIEKENEELKEKLFKKNNELIDLKQALKIVFDSIKK